MPNEKPIGRKQINLILAIVIAVVVGGAGFCAGIYFQKSKTPKGLGDFSRTGGGRLGQNGAQNQMRPVSGEIISQDDKSFTVKLQDGSTKIILFSDSATISKSTSGTKEDIKTGEKVMVTGKENSDKSITPQNISIGDLNWR